MKRFRFGGEEYVQMERMNSMASVLMLLSRGGDDHESYTSSSPARVFECKTCNRQFPSFQALGGHRASHKKPRIASADGGAGGGKPRVHECSICGLEFAIGQALGGHMRRHRAADQKIKRVWLDLNLPPPENHDAECGRKVGFVGSMDQIPMVDCFH